MTPKTLSANWFLKIFGFCGYPYCNAYAAFLLGYKYPFPVSDFTCVTGIQFWLTSKEYFVLNTLSKDHFLTFAVAKTPDPLDTILIWIVLISV